MTSLGDDDIWDTYNFTAEVEQSFDFADNSVDAERFVLRLILASEAEQVPRQCGAPPRSREDLRQLLPSRHPLRKPGQRR